MFLIQDHQPQIFERHIFLDQLVSANGDIDRAIRDTLQRQRRFLRRTKPRKFRNLHRPFSKTIRKILEVLLGQQRSRYQNCHLLSGRHRNKRGPQRYLGFTKAHVAADEAVHRFAGSHVCHDRLDGGGLIGGFFEWKGGGKSIEFIQF